MRTAAKPEIRTLVTPRLLLVPVRPAEARAIMLGNGNGRIWAREYPLDGTRVVVAAYLAQVDRGQDPQPYGPYQIVLRAGGRVIGDIGFHAPPDSGGSVTLGYGLVPEERGNGYATEALRRVIVWGLAQPPVSAVLADTTHDNVPSRRVMERAGMRAAGSDARKLYYRLP
jgi:RimJ/RimL family protein N-acetyltransferase